MDRVDRCAFILYVALVCGLAYVALPAIAMLARGLSNLNCLTE